MSRIEWGKAGERLFETGVERGVLYPRGQFGSPWMGLVQVSEEPSGGEAEALYYDGVKYMDYMANEDFQASVEAISTPPAFAQCEGVKSLSPGLYVSQQPRRTFGFCYRTLIGNDLVGKDFGYKLHLIYNATAAPSGRTNKTITRTVDPDVRTWTFTTVPPAATTYRPTAHISINSTEVDPAIMQEIEDILYGVDAAPGVIPSDARLPTIPELVSIMGPA